VPAGGRPADPEHSPREQVPGTAAHSGNGSSAFPGEFLARPAEGAAGVSNGTGAAASPWTAPPWQPTVAPAAAPAPAAPNAATDAAAAGAPAPHSAAVPPAPDWAGPAGWPEGHAYPQPQPIPEPSPRRPAPRTHRWGLGAYLLVEAVFLLTSVLVGALVVGAGQPLTGGVVAIALSVPTVLAAGVALLITRVRGNGPREDLRLSWSWRDVGLGVAFGLGGLLVTIPASVLFVTIVGEDATSAVGDVVGGTRASMPMALLIFFIVVLVAPLCEEIVYRGLLWGGVERLTGPRLAFAVSTLLFALAHFEFTRTPLLLVVAIPIAAARYYTGRLLASIVAHQINNLLPGLVLLLTLLGALPTG
jgi:membrane protease YdiL (CAAX protease family)